jgi:ribokinase
VKSIGATGARDAVIAALAVGFAERLPLAQAARLANAAAASATARLGAQAGLPTRADLS